MNRLAKLLGLLLLAQAFTAAIPRSIGGVGYYASPQWVTLYAVGLLLFLCGEQKKSEEQPSWASLAVAVAAAVLLWQLAPMPLTLVAIPPALYAVAGLASRVFKRPMHRGPQSLAVIAIAWCIVYLIWQKVVPDIRSLDALGTPLAWFINLLGEGATPLHDRIVIESAGSYSTVYLGIADIFPPVFLYWGVALVASVSLRRLAALRLQIVGLLALAALCLAFRYAAVAVQMASSSSSVLRLDEMAIFISVCIAVLPILCVLAWIKLPDLAPTARPAPQAYARYALATGCFLLLCGLVLEVPGPAKKGRLLFAGRNSVWEPTDYPVNTSLYGVKTVYNYTDFRQELSNFYQVQSTPNYLSDAELKAVDVLVLSCPTKPYTDDEVAAIGRFVDRGGGVWLIGDHTDVFGMSLFLNQVLKRYGCEMVADAVVDPISTRQLFGSDPTSHPVVRRMENPYLFYTTCSVKCPWTTEDILVGHRMYLDRPDFSQNTFFGNFEFDPDEYLGDVHQVVGIHSGAGRLLIWPDSTTFSTFCMFMPGQAEVAVDTADWLNHKNPTIPWSLLLKGFGLAAIAAAIVWGKARNPQSYSNDLLLGSGLGLLVAVALNNRLHTVPIRMSSPPTISFLADRRSDAFPLASEKMEPRPDCYWTCFVAAQRKQLRPYVAFNTEDALKAPVCVIPARAYNVPHSEYPRFAQWLKKGGRLVFLDLSAADPNCQLAKYLGIDLKKTKKAKSIVTGSNGPVGKQAFDQVVASGTAVLSSGPNTVAAAQNIDQGKVFVSTTASLFSDYSVGNNSDIPNAAQMDLLQILYSSYEPIQKSEKPNTVTMSR